MPFTSSQLNTELVSDPVGMGYAPLVTQGNDQGLANLINNVLSSVSVFRNDIGPGEVLAKTVFSEYLTLTTDRRAFYASLVGVDRIDATSSELRTSVGTIFTSSLGPLTRTNLQTLASRTGSRAEAIFGTGTQIRAIDIARALRTI